MGSFLLFEGINLVGERAYFDSATVDRVSLPALGSQSTPKMLGSSMNFEPLDALVYASVTAHLSRSTPAQSCFLNRDSKDFADPDVIGELARYNCKFLPRFDYGYDYVRHTATRDTPDVV
jgi:hypothetical protein